MQMERVAEACRKAGCPHLQVVGEYERPAPYMLVKSGTLYVSPDTAEMFTDEELVEVVRHTSVAPTRQWLRLSVWHAFLWPWGYLALLLVLGSLLFRVPLWGVAMIFALAQVQRRTSAKHAMAFARSCFDAFLAAGGDGPVFLRASVKVNAAVVRRLPSGFLRNHTLKALWDFLHWMAAKCGVGTEELQQMMAYWGPELLEARSVSRWRLLLSCRGLMSAGILFFFLLLIISVAIAMQLNS